LNGQLVNSSTNPGPLDENIVWNNAQKGTYLIQIAHNSSVYDPFFCYRIKPMTSNTPWQMKPDGDLSPATDGLQAHVYPNPCTGEMNLKITVPQAQEVQVRIYNLVQEQLYYSSFEVEEGPQMLHVPIDLLASGMYMV